MKRVALICDIKNWAFDIGANVIKKYLSAKYEIDIFYLNDTKYNQELFSILEDVKEYDVIHFFWRKVLLQFEDETFINKVKAKYGDSTKYINQISKKISTGVYDHLFLEQENINLYKNVFNRYAKKYVVSSKKLYNIYSDIPEYEKPDIVLGDVVDDEKFKIQNANRFVDFEKSDRELVIGWVGNSNWNIKYMDFKGFHTIIEPVLDELMAKGYPIKKHYADKNIKARTNDEMPKYYSEIDACLCTSMTEGTPRPIMESILCGVPVITTNVGIVEDVFEEKQKNFILGERVDATCDETIKQTLKEKIIRLITDRKLLNQLSNENLSIKTISTKSIIEKYDEYFKNF